MTDIAKLAAGLSEAQRTALLRTYPDERQMGGFGLRFGPDGDWMKPPLVEQDGINHPIFGAHYRLNSLGLAVRAHLQSERKQ